MIKIFYILFVMVSYQGEKVEMTTFPAAFSKEICNTLGSQTVAGIKRRVPAAKAEYRCEPVQVQKKHNA